MRRFVACALVLSLVTPAVAQTSGSEEKKKAKKGALLGGLFGAAKAIIQGKSPEQVLGAAAKGAAIGAAIGYAIGKIETRRLTSRREAQERVGHTSGSGTYFRIDDVTVMPSALSPGATAQMVVRYTVLPSNDWDSAPVKVHPKLLYGSDQVGDLGEQACTTEVGGGTYVTSLEIPFPNQAPEGTYTLSGDWVGAGSPGRTTTEIHLRS